MSVAEDLIRELVVALRDWEERLIEALQNAAQEAPAPEPAPAPQEEPAPAEVVPFDQGSGPGGVEPPAETPAETETPAEDGAADEPETPAAPAEEPQVDAAGNPTQ